MAEKKIKILSLEMKEYATKKPIAITPKGKFVMAFDVAKTPSLAVGSLHALEENLQVKLTLERNKLEPSFKLGIIGVGIVTKNEVIEHVKTRTELGKEIVRAEMNYLNDLNATITARTIPRWQPTPSQSPNQFQWNGDGFRKYGGEGGNPSLLIV